VISGATQRWVTAGQWVHIGREADNDVVLSAPTVSRRHVRIGYEGDGWVLTDLGSAAGTWFDGQRVQRFVLSGDQTFLLGDPDTGTPVRVCLPPPMVRPRRRRWFGRAGG
jgi:pSer/pThr/pTyr-binding forkhead associated (FHA) protein